MHERLGEQALIDVCPLAYVWHEIYQRLVAATKDRQDIFPPPVPLILAGWAYSNDVQKQERWHETLRWAHHYGLSSLIGEITPDLMYRTMDLTDYDVGPMGGPCHLPWSFDAKPSLSPEDRTNIISILRGRWMEIAGGEIAQLTKPLRLTGRKGRRLLVEVMENGVPPWGSWTRLAPGESRRAFTRFRASVNAVIDPFAVDHIDFVKAPAGAKGG